ncbi:MAG: DNA topoisomerase IV subunit A [Kiritimatiellia bacterium]
MSKKPENKTPSSANTNEPPSLFENMDLFSNSETLQGEEEEVEADEGADENEESEELNSSNALHYEQGGSGPLRELMDQNFLQFASYTICNRAIPTVEDGFKPVQRRIMHALKEKDDGRFIKVANVVGHTMQYHPHGDASIADAIVNLTNKRYLIEGQGNFGSIHTGDRAAASRYIECRLTDLARTQLFNQKITTYIPSYDGRNQEPVLLPCKIPLLLMLGAEGIAVGLSTYIMPHNFIELLEAQINIIRQKPFQVLPDFPTGGKMDVAEYADGMGKIKVRATIAARDKNKLVITQLPFGQTTETLINNIEEAIRKKKLAVKQINDYTAEKVEIELVLASGTSQERATQMLYAFTSCESSVSTRPVVLYRNRPVEMTTSEILKACTELLMDLLKRELELRLNELDDLFHSKTLEQIFIEERIYQRIEEKVTWEEVQKAVVSGFEPFLNRLRRAITLDDVDRLLQIKIRRISRYDINKSRQEIENILEEEATVKGSLNQLKRYTTQYLNNLIKKYRAHYPRLTEAVDSGFKQVEVRKLTASELSLKIDRANGYIGTELKTGDELFQCSSLDKIIVVWEDGSYKMLPPPDKLFVDSNWIYCQIFDKAKEFTAVYREPEYGFTYIKRFAFGGAIQHKDYRLAPEKSKILLFQEGAPESIFVKYKPAKHQQIHQQVFAPLAEVRIKGVAARGIQMTTKDIARIVTKEPSWWKESERGSKGILT